MTPYRFNRFIASKYLKRPLIKRGPKGVKLAKTGRLSKPWRQEDWNLRTSFYLKVEFPPFLGLQDHQSLLERWFCMDHL